MQQEKSELENQRSGVFACWLSHKRITASGQWAYDAPVIRKAFAGQQTIFVWNQLLNTIIVVKLHLYFQRCCHDGSHVCRLDDWRNKTEGTWPKPTTFQEALEALGEADRCARIGLVKLPSSSPLMSSFEPSRPWSNVQCSRPGGNWLEFLLPFPSGEHGLRFSQAAFERLGLDTNSPPLPQYFGAGRYTGKKVLLLVAVSCPRIHSRTETHQEGEHCTERDATIANWRAAAAVMHRQAMPDLLSSLVETLSENRWLQYFRSTTLPVILFKLLERSLRCSTSTGSTDTPQRESSELSSDSETSEEPTEG